VIQFSKVTNILNIVLAIFAFTFPVLSLAEVGCILQWSEQGFPNLKEVVLPEFDKQFLNSNGVLTSLLLEIKWNSNESQQPLFPNSDGKYCFPLNDRRTHSIHTFYYGHLILNYWAELFQELDKAPLPKLVFELSYTNPGEMPHASAQSSDRTIKFYFLPSGINQGIDPTIIAHELGHVLDESIARDTSGTSATLLDRAEVFSVKEGIAHIFSLLWSGSPKIGLHNLGPELAYDMDRFMILSSQLPTEKDFFEKVIASHFSRNAFFKTVVELEGWMNTDPNGFVRTTSRIDDYTASAVLAQPFFQAGKIFGNREIAKQFILALSRVPSTHKYNPEAIVKETLSHSFVSQPKVYKFLREEFEKRGFNISIE
jgi:hypothetical protein